MVLGISSEGENNGAHVTGGRWFESIIPNNNGGLAQLARALALHARGHRFDSDILHSFFGM